MEHKSIFLFIAVFLLAFAPFGLAAKTGSYSNEINMERVDGVLVIDVSPGIDPCGDGILQTAYGEQCDGSISFDCSDIDSSLTGDLSCSSSCLYDTSACTAVIVPPVVIPGGGSPGGSGDGPSGVITTNGNSTDGDSCVEDWSCNEWSVCIEDLEMRTCEDSNECGTEKIKPLDERGCTITETIINYPKKGFMSLFTGAVIGGMEGKSLVGIIILGLLIIGGLWYVIAKKKDADKVTPATKKDVKKARKKPATKKSKK